MQIIRQLILPFLKWTYLAIFLLSQTGCKKENNNTLFKLLNANHTGVVFENSVNNKEDFNIFTYRNFYNGGGVATGDINNDGLPDIYLTANMGPNKLYVNKGNFNFEEAPLEVGIAGAEGKWSTGVVMVDINHDNWLDIYVCNAGFQKGIGQENELFINNKDGSFTESAQKYGLNDSGYTTHAAFFDFDLDGDLDVYILNNSFIPVNTLNYANNRNLRAKDWQVKDFLKGGGDKLLRNDNGHFVDVSEHAGIYGSLIGFGLGVTVGDINNDQLPDIYVSNDFFERDYLYINNGDGTFSEELEGRIKHTSLASMGADMADINNDGYPELFATDMLPRDEYRLRTSTSFENHYIFDLKKDKGFSAQYMQNSLQLNNQDGTFSEIANAAGVAASDWSWGALMFDADNDGLTDIFVCNGIYHDVIDQDFIDFFANDVAQKMVVSGVKESMREIVDKMPSTPLSNVFFHNEGGNKFIEKGKDYGFEAKTFSNGAAYADLDNDGDLDLIINNVNQPVSIYKNESENTIKPANYFKIQLQGDRKNTYAIGAVVKLYADSQIFSRQLFPSKGFQSSTEYPVTIGLGTINKLDSLVVIWPNRKVTRQLNPALNRLVKVHIDDAHNETYHTPEKRYTPYFSRVANTFDTHRENKYDDYYDERNIPQLLSKEGPKAAIGDVNGDGTEDVYICGATGQAGQLYFQQGSKFVKSSQEVFAELADFEDTAALFFDSDGDGDLDLIVGSGGNQASGQAPELPSRLYLNDGYGRFTLNRGALPPNGMNTAVICANDYDQDGDLDLFLGNRSTPKEYGTSPKSAIYRNDGRGGFTNVSKKLLPGMQNMGMVRDAVWQDIDGDGVKELIVVGDWMSPRVFRYSSSRFHEVITGLEEYSGFWGSVYAIDIDNDGDQDLVLGNIGDNFSLKASKSNPLKLWIHDFNTNGVTEKVLTKSVNSKDFSVLLKRELTTQFPFLKKKSLKHSEFATKTIQDLFPSSLLESATLKTVNFIESALAINDGKGHFSIQVLPNAVQSSCINAIAGMDVNKDGKQDLILGGNFSHFIPQLGALDACNGHVLINNGKGIFTVLNSKQSGLKLDGEIKQIGVLNIGETPHLMGLMNNQQPVLYKNKKE